MQRTIAWPSGTEQPKRNWLDKRISWQISKFKKDNVHVKFVKFIHSPIFFSHISWMMLNLLNHWTQWWSKLGTVPERSAQIASSDQSSSAGGNLRADVPTLEFMKVVSQTKSIQSSHFIAGSFGSWRSKRQLRPIPRSDWSQAEKPLSLFDLMSCIPNCMPVHWKNYGKSWTFHHVSILF